MKVETMEYIHNGNRQALTVIAVLVTFTTLCAAGRSAINLDISRSLEPSGRPGGMMINCSIDTTAAGIDKLARLTVFGSRPYGAGDDLDQLAVFDIWSKSPKLAEDLEEADVSVVGDLSSEPLTTPHLELIWRSYTASSRQVFKCVANGMDSDGQAASVSTTVQVGAMDAGCCYKMDKLSTELTGLSDKMGATLNLTGEVASQIISLNTLFGNMEALFTTADGRVITQIQSLANKFEKLEGKFDDVYGRNSPRMQTLTDKMEELQKKLNSLEQNINLQFRLSGIDKGRFDVSSVYEGRVYLVSKAEEVFNIARANNYCRESGGYLVELDDGQEYQFVFNLVSTIRGANSFWTGGNDIEEEGTWVYYNSKKPVPQLSWSGGQPDNMGGHEDCMEIRLNFGGLNDWLCNQPGKFICEIPI